MTDDLYIWIVRWQEFQHYRPNPNRGPAWIKMYTAQLSDASYLDLNDKQRSVLHDLRMLFSTLRGKVPKNTRMISGLIGQRVTNPTLERLNHAGFIEVISRETLEQRLDKFYSRSRAEVEVEKEKERSSVSPSTSTYTTENGRTENEPGEAERLWAQLVANKDEPL